MVKAKIEVALGFIDVLILVVNYVSCVYYVRAKRAL